MQKTPSATISGGLTIPSDQGVSSIGLNTTSHGGAYSVAPNIGMGLPTGINLVTASGSGYTAATVVIGAPNLPGGTQAVSLQVVVVTPQHQLLL